MSNSCFSCGMPLQSDKDRRLTTKYCNYCTDDAGNLLPKEQVMQGIAQWLRSWQPGLTDTQATTRAAAYMQAMPAWADE
jgi:hypothetical protein